MTFNRAEVVDRNFVQLLRNWAEPRTHPILPDAPVRKNRPLTGAQLLELLESQIITRHLDLIARALRAKNASFYTIGSAGHEGNAAVGRATRHTDPAFLHYRSGAFMVERARKRPDIDIIRDTILSQAASAEDPIAGGRHKVWGSKPLWVPPQTSTIASHLPKAVGTAIAIRRARQLRHQLPIPDDSIVVCSFGDASTNHSTALGAFNAARWASYQKLPVPILFVCEDNGIGISVRTPPGWVHENFRHIYGWEYIDADGLDIVEAHAAAVRAADTCRRRRMPVFLHLRVVRLLGHAGTDFEPAYHTSEQIAETEARDPLLATARTVLRAGLLTPDEILERYESVRRRVNETAEYVITRPRLTAAGEIITPLAPHHADTVHEEATRCDYHNKRIEAFGGEDKLPERAEPRHLAAQINAALFDLMAKYPEAVVFGEDVAQKGGVYYVTKDLHKQFKAARVFNTLLDEQTILGLAQGCGLMGMMPIPEIQYLAYFHNACDQIRGEACSLQFFSNDQFRNPMIVRIAGLAYQKGFGGHFHNDNSFAALRDVPGLVIACPARGDDAAAMLRTCAALAKIDGRIIAWIEPIALYMTRDLHAEGDGQWLSPYPPPDVAVPLGEGRVYHENARDLAIITYGNGLHLSLQAAKVLADTDNVHARVIDLRWLNPLNTDLIAKHAADCGRVLVVDEGRKTGGIAEAIFTAVIERCGPGIPLKRTTGHDTYIPLGPAANLVLPSRDTILTAARQLMHNV